MKVMGHFLSYKEAANLTSKLIDYDVRDSGWEHESRGFEFNANHVLKHLVRDTMRKDFFDEKVVKSEIVPDSLQYAFRLARWAGLRREYMLPNQSSVLQTEAFDRLQRISSPRIGAYQHAQSKLADHLHDLDHVSLREVALEERFSAISTVGRLLVHSAQLSANEFGFDLPQAFDDRLTQLRERFNIPETETA